MHNAYSPLLADITSLADLYTAAGHGLGLIMVFAILKAINLLWTGFHGGMHNGSWKTGFMQAMGMLFGPPLIMLLVTFVYTGAPTLKPLFA